MKVDSFSQLNAKAYNPDVEAHLTFPDYDWDKRRKLIKIIESLSPSLFSDVGSCGGALFYEYLRAKPVTMECFDISAESVQASRKRGFVSWEWAAGLEKCPVEDKRYDLVVASEIIEHILDTDYFLSELKRICKPGGYVLLTTPNLYYWLSRIRFVFGLTPWNYPGVSTNYKFDPHITLEHIRINGRLEWEKFFSTAGFKIKKVSAYSAVNPRVSLKQRVIYSIDNCLGVNLRSHLIFLLQVPMV